MALEMDEGTFLGFYRDTVMGYSAAFRRYALNLMEKMELANFSMQAKCSAQGENGYSDIPFVEKTTAIATTTMNLKFAPFYEYLEFIKLYKYSVPFFYELPEETQLVDILSREGYKKFELKTYVPDFKLGVNIGEEFPVYFLDSNEVYIKFVLQKSYFTLEGEIKNYRFPIVIYMDLEQSVLEIRYDSVRYDPTSGTDTYNHLVMDCLNWLKHQLDMKLFSCNHNKMIDILKNNDDGSVKIYKQMMELSSGGSAELTAPEQGDYVLPFVGELRELIEENEEVFERCADAKKLLLQYLDDKEATANYSYIYIKWVKPVESDSYTVKVAFDYFNARYTLMQHISGHCKDLGKERMNNAIRYLCKNGSFVKGEET